jgi:soluble lytic murein transglycosylase-like protein
MKNPEGYDNYTVNYPHQAAWLVYFNGLEVPVTTVTVEYGVNKIATCNVDMPPDPRLVRLGNEDRIELDVFYLDEFAYDSSQFCLMGEFDIVGWAYTNSASGRSLRFMALDTVQILQQLNMFYISAVDDIVNAYLPPQGTKGEFVTQATLYYPASLFLQGLMQGMVTPQQKAEKDLAGDTDVVDKSQFIKSPFQFIWNVFLALLSDVDFTNADPMQTSDPNKLPCSATSAPGKNFFARYILSRNLYRRFVGLPFIDKDMLNPQDGCFPIIKACQETEVTEAIQSQLGASVGPSGTVWDLLNMILGTMYMEVATIPAPPIGMAEIGSGVMVDEFLGVQTSPDKKYMGVIASHMIKPQCYFGLPPTCNVIFPSMVQSLSLEENYLPQPTRLYIGEQFLSNLIAAKGNAASAQLTTSTLTKGYPPVVDARMQQYMLAQYQNTKNFLIYPEEFFRGPVSRQVNAPPWLYLLDQFRNSMKPDTTGEGTGTDAGATASGTTAPAPWKPGKSNFVKQATVLVNKYAGLLGVPKDFVWARIYTESRFTANVGLGAEVTNKKTGEKWRASGAMQLSPATIVSATKGIKKFFPHEYNDTVVIDPTDPTTNIAMGIWNIYNIMNHATDPPATPADLQKQSAIFSETAPVNKMCVILCRYASNFGAVVEQARKDGKTMRDVAVKYGYDPNAKPPKDGSFKKILDNFVKFWDVAQVEIQKVGNSGASNAQPPTTPTQPQTAPNAPVSNQNEEDWSYQSVDKLAQQEQIQMEALEIKSLGKLFDLYAQYEYYRSRYESRIGAAVLAFNPYIVPAFPAVMFDSKYSGISTFGYILNVTHQMSAAAGSPNMTTTVNSAFQRTFSEAAANERQGWDDTVWNRDAPQFVEYDTYPTEAIPDVAQIFQNVNNADLFYSKLFYLKKMNVPLADAASAVEQAEQVEALGMEVPESAKSYVSDVKEAIKRRDRMMKAKGVSAVFNFRKVVDVVRLGENGEVVEHNVPSWAYLPGMEIRPSAVYAEHFRSYDTAMSYVARPVCTLQQYIELRHGMSLEAAIKAGYVAGEEPSFYSSLTAGKNKTGAKFWSRIFLLRQGPGDPKDEEIYVFANCRPASENYIPVMPAWTPLPAVSSLPQTRQDWDKILTDYRNVVRSRDGTGGAPRR